MAFAHDFVEASVVIEHDGSVRVMREIDRTVDIESVYNAMYNEIKDEYSVTSLAKYHALTKFYEWATRKGGLFV